VGVPNNFSPVKYPSALLWNGPPHLQFPSIFRSSVWTPARSPDLISRSSHFHWRIRRNPEQNQQRALSVPLEHWRMDPDARFETQCQSLCRSSFSSSYRPLWNLLKINSHKLLFHHHKFKPTLVPPTFIPTSFLSRTMVCRHRCYFTNTSTSTPNLDPALPPSPKKKIRAKSWH